MKKGDVVGAYIITRMKTHPGGAVSSYLKLHKRFKYSLLNKVYLMYLKCLIRLKIK